jgi:perosamine synthetase
MTRDIALEELPKFNIPVRAFFYPLSSLPAYKHLEFDGRQKNPVSNHNSENSITLPCAINLTEKNLDTISKAIHSILVTKKCKN